MRNLKWITKRNDPAHFTVNTNLIGTAQFAPTFDLFCPNEQRPDAVRVTGRLVAPVGGGNVTLRLAPVDDGVNPTVEYPSARISGAASADTDNVAVATTSARSFSAVFYMPSQAPLPADYYAIRISNSAAAYTGGQVIIDTVEVLAR